MGRDRAGPKPAAAVSGDSAASVVHRFVPDRPVTDDTTLEELGLSSIERIELMMVLEQEFDQPVDEVSFAAATTVADLQQLVTTTPIPGDESTVGIHSPSEALEVPQLESSQGGPHRPAYQPRDLPAPFDATVRVDHG